MLIDHVEQHYREPQDDNEDRMQELAAGQVWCGAFRRRPVHSLGILVPVFPSGRPTSEYMSIESDINARRPDSIRARHYAIAGINSAAGDIWKWIQEDRPAEEQTLYSYGVYGGRPDSHEDCPVLLETHTAEARVSIEPVDASTWAARFKSAPPWPGEGKVFHLVSTSEIKRAEAGSMRTLGRYSVESILAVDNGQYRILSLGTHWE